MGQENSRPGRHPQLQDGKAVVERKRLVRDPLRALWPAMLQQLMQHLDAQDTVALARCTVALYRTACSPLAWGSDTGGPVSCGSSFRVRAELGSARLWHVRRSRLALQAPLTLAWRSAADDWDHAGSGWICAATAKAAGAGGHKHGERSAQDLVLRSCCEGNTSANPSLSASASKPSISDIPTSAVATATSSVPSVAASPASSFPSATPVEAAAASSAAAAAPAAPSTLVAARKKGKGLGVKFDAALGDAADDVHKKLTESAKRSATQRKEVEEEEEEDEEAEEEEKLDEASGSDSERSASVAPAAASSVAGAGMGDGDPLCCLRIVGLEIIPFLRDVQLEDLPHLLSAPCARSLTSVRFSPGLRPADDSMELLASLPRLKRLHLSVAPTEPECLQPLPRAPVLSELAVGFTMWLREERAVACLEPLSLCAHLRRLILRRAVITPAAFVVLLSPDTPLARNLEYLELDNCACPPTSSAQPAAAVAAVVAASAAATAGSIADACVVPASDPNAMAAASGSLYRRAFCSLVRLRSMRLVHVLGLKALLPHLCYAPALRWLELEVPGPPSAPRKVHPTVFNSGGMYVLGHANPSLTALAMLHEDAPLLRISLRVTPSPCGPIPPGGVVEQAHPLRDIKKDPRYIEWKKVRKGVWALPRVTLW